MKYKLSQEARLDLARIYWRGVETFGERQAERYFENLTRRFDVIAATPTLYPAVDHIRAGYRRSVCGVDCIYYRVTGKTVEIMRILGRQDVAENILP